MVLPATIKAEDTPILELLPDLREESKIIEVLPKLEEEKGPVYQADQGEEMPVDV